MKVLARQVLIGSFGIWTFIRYGKVLQRHLLGQWTVRFERVPEFMFWSFGSMGDGGWGVGGWRMARLWFQVQPEVKFSPLLMFQLHVLHLWSDLSEK